MACSEPAFRRINQAEVHNLSTRSAKPLFDHLNGSFQPLFKTWKLFPVSGEPDSEQANPKICQFPHLHSFQFFRLI
jgi:hypothetical protein